MKKRTVIYIETLEMILNDADTERRTERAKRTADELRARITNGREKTALEYGCGTGLVVLCSNPSVVRTENCSPMQPGRLGLELADEFKNLLLVDASPEKVKQVVSKLNALAMPNVSVLCADFTEGAPPDIRADYIFLSLALHHIKDTANILRRFREALSDGGRLLIVDINSDDGSFHAQHPDFDGHNGFDRAELAALAEAAGFAVIENKTFYCGSKLVNKKNAAYSMFIMEAAVREVEY